MSVKTIDITHQAPPLKIDPRPKTQDPRPSTFMVRGEPNGFMGDSVKIKWHRRPACDPFSSFVACDNTWAIPLADLLALVADGDEVVIAEEGKVLARLMPAESFPPRVAGLHQGMGWISEDFDEPLPDEFWAGRV
jgi:antitoxin (DNA-binding transcriptional repressor) of toxin-antitoxin stability system